MEFLVENENLQKALILRKEGNPEALVWLEKACAENDSKALFFKGIAQRHGGFFLKRDGEAAKSSFKQSAMAGCPWAMLEYGSSCKKNEKQEWYVACNDDYACGLCFLNGYGVEKSPEKARDYLLRACKVGNPFAQMDLARESYLGKEKAAWLEKAALFGEAGAQSFLAYLLCKGRFVEQREKKAFLWYLRGAQQKHADCCFHVAECYQKGNGCKENLPLSALFYLDYGNSHTIETRLLSEFNDRRIRLQELFVYGKGLKRDPKLIADGGEEVCLNAIRIYEESTKAARKAVLCFVWICKQSNHLNRDIQRLVGRSVFDSRVDPAVWNVALRKKRRK